jgi:hypothetical protein
MNAVHRFIPVVKAMDVPVILVLNVGHYDTFYWQINKDSSEVMLDRNRRLIQTFIDNGVQIFAVEVGNEEYLHVPKGNVRPPTWNYNFLQKMVGQQKKDALFREEVLSYYRMYAQIYERHIALIDSFGLPAVVPMVNNSTYQWQQWNQAVSHLKAEYGVWHHYEQSTDSNAWKPVIDNYLSAIRAQGRLPICTEYNFWFGDQGTEKSSRAATDGTMDRYNLFLESYARAQGVPVLLKHRLNGDPAMRAGAGVPYDWYRAK